MKKIILLIVIIFLGGCYDYVEINDLAFISSVGIDYQNDEYLLTVEILSDTKQGENEAKKKSSTISGNGATLAKAFDNIALKIDKNAYYHHLKAIILSKEVAQNHLEEIVDYLVRNPKIRNEFFLTIAIEKDAKDFITASNDTNPVIGDEITEAVETGYYNTAYNKSFEDFLARLINTRTEAVATTLNLEDDKIAIEGVALFKDFSYVKTLSPDDSAIFNILANYETNYLITKSYDDLPLSVKVYSSKVNYDFKGNKIKVNIDLLGEIVENASNLNLKDEDTYKKINVEYADIITKDFNRVLGELKNDNIDALGLNNIQYKKSKKEQKNLLENADFEVNVKLTINRKGLIFEVD